MKRNGKLFLVEVLTDGTRIQHYLKPDGHVTIRMKISKKGGQELEALFLDPAKRVSPNQNN